MAASIPESFTYIPNEGKQLAVYNIMIMIAIIYWSLDTLVSLTGARVEPEIDKSVPGPAPEEGTLQPEVQQRQLVKLRKKKSASRALVK